MTEDNEKVISILNNLIETCKDGQEGFKTAAENVYGTEIKSLFYDYSQQRSQFAGQLQEEVRHLGGDPEKLGSVSGELHRAWMEVKTALAGKDQASILGECERGEDAALKVYRDAIEQKLPQPVLEVVTEQLAAIKQAHDAIRSLRDTAQTVNA